MIHFRRRPLVVCVHWIRGTHGPYRLVNVFGVSADGQPVYIQESVSNATNGVNTPYLAPNAANQPVSIQAASAGARSRSAS